MLKAVVPLAIQQAIVKTMFVVAPWARQQIYVIHGQMLWPLARNNICCPTELFPTASHLIALSLQRAKHASLGKACKNILPISRGGGLTNKNQTCFFGKACKNILPTSCEVMGMSHLSSCVRGKI